MKRFVTVLLIATILYGVLAIVCLMYAFGETMARFDNPALRESELARIAGMAAQTLLAPGRFVWTRWASENLPNFVEWIVVIGNSVVWGVAVAVLFEWIRNAYLRRGEKTQRDGRARP